jgi:prepilin peptidase CpaA
MGAGNAKLMGVVGAFLGAKGVLTAFLYISAICGINALSVILQHRGNLKFSIINFKVMLYNALITYKLLPGTKMLSTDLPRLKYALAISFGTGLYIINQTNNLCF